MSTCVLPIRTWHCQQIHPTASTRQSALAQRAALLGVIKSLLIVASNHGPLIDAPSTFSCIFFLARASRAASVPPVSSGVLVSLYLTLHCVYAARAVRRRAPRSAGNEQTCATPITGDLLVIYSRRWATPLSAESAATLANDTIEVFTTT